ncbi:MAG TPA: pitrilysin family protein [Candidatus Deferrimicrobiaceae bacterium]|nr:pitrilysin family protein [Candidatus Deferrimicrobiaceae bacterium]
MPAPVRDVLPNGMRLIIQEHRAASTVAIHLWAGVGGRDEAVAERGFSHFAEHMLFKGTDTRPRGFVERDVEAVGGRTNAGTSNDYTFYYLLLPATQARPGIALIADMVLNSVFDPIELGRERDVVFEEMRLNEDNPRTSLGRQLYNLLYQGHPYGRPVLGDADDLRAATRETLRGYYKRHYVPENMALVVVGPVNPAEVRAAAIAAFGALPRTGYVRQPPPPAAPLDGVRARSVERPERQTQLGFAWLAPPLGHPDMAAVDVLGHILGGSRSSRLNQALREKARLVSGISGWYGPLQGAGAVGVTAQLESADPEAVERAILTEIRRIQDDGVTADELARAITASEAEREFSRETVEGLALAYGRAETTWSLEAERSYLDRVRAVTRAQVQEAARRYLTDAYARLAYMPRGRAR